MPDIIAEPVTLATAPEPAVPDATAAAAAALFKTSTETKPAATEVKVEETAEQKAAAELKAKTEADAKVATEKAATEAEATRRAALTEDQRKAEDEAKAKAEAEKAKAKVVPEKYEFKAPEGATNDPALIAEFSGVAKELELTQDQAQKLYDLHVKTSQNTAVKTQAEIAKTQASWAEASKADKEFGGDKLQENLGVAKLALDLNPAIRTLLNESKLGDHPEVIRWMFRAGKLVQQDTMVRGQLRDGPKDPAKVLYPNNA